MAEQLPHHEMFSPLERLVKGSPLEVVETVYLYPGETAKVLFKFNETAFPLGKKPLRPTDTIGVHIRSRNAHLFHDVTDETAEDMKEKFSNPWSGEPLAVFEMVNRGSRTGIIRAGDMPLHMYVVPKDAWVTGAQLDAIVKDHPGMGKDLHIDALYSGDQTVSKAIFQKVSDERFWLPPGDPIEVGHYPTFEEARAELFGNHMKRVDDKDNPLPTKGHIFVAAIPHIELPKDTYMVIDRVVYTKKGNNFDPTGYHLFSPLVEARTNMHGHNAELARGDWIRFRIAKNGGGELKAG